MKKMCNPKGHFIAVLFLALHMLSVSGFSVSEFVKDLLTKDNWQKIESYLDQGPMNSYFTYESVVAIYNETAIAMPEIME